MGMTRRLACGDHRDLEGLVDTHLFGIRSNNGGPTFLMQALAASRATLDRVFRAHRDTLDSFGDGLIEAAR